MTPERPVSHALAMRNAIQRTAEHLYMALVDLRGLDPELLDAIDEELLELLANKVAVLRRA